MAMQAGRLVAILITIWLTTDGPVTSANLRTPEGRFVRTDYETLMKQLDHLRMPVYRDDGSSEEDRPPELRSLAEELNRQRIKIANCYLVESLYQLFCAEVDWRNGPCLALEQTVIKYCTPPCGFKSEQQTCRPCQECPQNQTVRGLCAPSHVCCSK